jgi:DNA replication and repair protein RecF
VRVECSYVAHTQDPDQYATILLRQLHNNLEKDVLRGFTSYGPHREDLKITLNKKDTKEGASRGEARSLVIMLKILELQLIEQARTQKPIILLDDVFSELDGSRRRALTDYLVDHQTIITTTDADAIVKSFLDGYNVIAMEPTNL